MCAIADREILPDVYACRFQRLDFRQQCRRIDHLRVSELRLDLRDAPLDDALPLLRRLVIGLLRKAAVRTRVGGPLIRLDRSGKSFQRAVPDSLTFLAP